MTRETAILCLKGMKNNARDTFTEQTDWQTSLDMAIKALEQEPRKGHWTHGKELSKEYRGRILVDVTYADWHCSNCNYVIKGTVKPKWNYCPNCGAKMIEPQESEENDGVRSL